MVIVDPEKGAVLPTIPMVEDSDDAVRSSIPVAQGQWFIRTNQKLYCIGRK
jgi:hypothetical protein